MNKPLISTQITIYSIIITVLLIAGWVTNYLLARHAVINSNQNLCPIFHYLTERPPPAKLKSARYFYQIVLMASRKEGC